jgi:hypothetical protein
MAFKEQGSKRATSNLVFWAMGSQMQRLCNSPNYLHSSTLLDEVQVTKGAYKGSGGKSHNGG